MSTGLAASTVTPGRTPPVVSRTKPLIALCAVAIEGASSTTTTRDARRMRKQMVSRMNVSSLRSLLSELAQTEADPSTTATTLSIENRDGFFAIRLTIQEFGCFYKLVSYVSYDKLSAANLCPALVEID